MTGLEKEILEELEGQMILSDGPIGWVLKDGDHAKEAAEIIALICRKHIEKAYQAGEEHKMVEDESGVHLRTVGQWLKENGPGGSFFE